MMHLVKLCVGVSSVEQLEAYRERRRAEGHTRSVHVTRMMPKQRDAIIEGGSLYWVIGGQIRARQRIIDLEAQTDAEGRSCCAIVMDPSVIRTVPQPKRPFQGWRYLKPGDAPADLGGSGDAGELPEDMAAELAELGLL